MDKREVKAKTKKPSFLQPVKKSKEDAKESGVVNFYHDDSKKKGGKDYKPNPRQVGEKRGMSAGGSGPPKKFQKGEKGERVYKKKKDGDDDEKEGKYDGKSKAFVRREKFKVSEILRELREMVLKARPLSHRSKSSSRSAWS